MFNPSDITAAINAAGAQLQDAWAKKKTPNGMISNMPENDLNPNTQQLAFRIKVLEDRCALLEDTLGKVVRALNGKSG
ncbi:MAG: hypothetical protein KGJ13_06610 [Patescibacteria group bacterium]|nr:hypothetical protein [Patescibacteria group bacterium]